MICKYLQHATLICGAVWCYAAVHFGLVVVAGRQLLLTLRLNSLDTFAVPNREVGNEVRRLTQRTLEIAPMILSLLGLSAVTPTWCSINGARSNDDAAASRAAASRYNM
jgi:hypothetical protein